MEGKTLLQRKLSELSLAQRMLHTLVLIGVPLFCWELFDLWREARHDRFFGTGALVSGLLLALLYGLGSAAVAALIEHALAAKLKKH